MKELIDLTREQVWALPPEVIIALIPPHLRTPPTTGRERAYWLLSAEKPHGHLPCPAGSGCTTCSETYALRHRDDLVPVELTDSPEAVAKARRLIAAWYAAGAATVAAAADDVPPFDPEMVP